MQAIELSERLCYYRGGLRVLRFCEQRRASGRRFGQDADESWKLFQGTLDTGDRVDLMLRDADAEWPRGFGARTVFDFRGVAEDEAFGADWPGLDGVQAEMVWREIVAEPALADIGTALAALAGSWSLALSPPGSAGLPALAPITPTAQFVAVGPSAIAALIAGFAGADDVDWSAQVTCIATPPAHRQLAAAAVPLLNLTKPCRLIAAAPSEQSNDQPGNDQPGDHPPVDPTAILIASSDADPADRALAENDYAA